MLRLINNCFILCQQTTFHAILTFSKLQGTTIYSLNLQQRTFGQNLLLRLIQHKPRYITVEYTNTTWYSVAIDINLVVVVDWVAFTKDVFPIFPTFSSK